MINLYESNICDILPEHLQTPETQALGYAIKRQVQKIMDYSQNTSVYAAIDILPERLLDILAVELRTQYYDEEFPVARKRELIKNTMPWYAKAGTPAAIQEMIDQVFDSGILIEWFETGGEPGTFSISTTSLITPDLINEFKRVIKYVKNVRSHLDSVMVGNKADINVNFAAGVAVHKKITLC